MFLCCGISESSRRSFWVEDCPKSVLHCAFVSLLQGRDDWRCGHCRQVQVCLLFDVWIYSEADVITYRFRPLSKTGQVQVYPQGDLGRSLKEIFHQVLHCDDIVLTLL